MQQIRYNGYEIYARNGNYFIKNDTSVSFNSLELAKNYIDNKNESKR